MKNKLCIFNLMFMHFFAAYAYSDSLVDAIDKIEKSDAVAIDIGFSIETSSIYLSEHFSHVIAVEFDKKSVLSLQSNLSGHGITNITVYPNRLSETLLRDVKSTETKTLASNEIGQSSVSTFKQMVFESVYLDSRIRDKEIKFIHCNIAGEEEAILEDLLHFAYNNKCKVIISFDVNNWQEKTIDEFSYLFNFFSVDCEDADPSQYLSKCPTATLIFDPKNNAGRLIKKNMPIVVIGYNQYTYIRNMVNQVKKYTNDIVVIDNASTYAPLLDYYKNEFNFTLLKQSVNYGHLVHHRKEIQKLVGEPYIVTDPDLQLNPNLPDNFIQELIEIADFFQASRVGFALVYDAPDIRTDIKFMGFTIKEWESQMWVKKITYPLKPELELYSAGIDTTFCLMNKKYRDYPIRVAGDFICVHIPWHTNFQNDLQPEEYEAYLKNNTSSNWFKLK